MTAKALRRPRSRPGVAREEGAAQPRLVVFSTLFPSPARPSAGVFVRERMFRVARALPLVVVAPVPWFPLQGIIRRFKPHFRPPAPRFEVQDGIEIHRPRFLCVPGVLKSLDGVLLALSSLATLRRLRRRLGVNLIDAHFAYPDGYAATWLGRWLGMPVLVTLRGTEVPLSRRRDRRALVAAAMHRADRLISVSASLGRLAAELGVPAGKVRVVGNGVDLERFYPVERDAARQRYAIAAGAPVLVSVGGLVERKGFHRVIACLPRLRESFPELRYLVVGGPTAEGDMGEVLREQVRALDLQDCVRFLGPLPPDELRWPLSAADVFVLATANEGWANVFLEAMACGLPVVTTRVGGNPEVVSDPALGTLVPFGDEGALGDALDAALRRRWDREVIRAHAADNTWENRTAMLMEEYRAALTGGEARVRDPEERAA